jgi:hypothetical protein
MWIDHLYLKPDERHRQSHLEEIQRQISISVPLLHNIDNLQQRALT